MSKIHKKKKFPEKNRGSPERKIIFKIFYMKNSVTIGVIFTLVGETKVNFDKISLIFSNKFC